MKLKKLKLENFQGIKSLELELNGNNASIYGTNGSGKTTIYNALTWLLFDKASTGEKGFSPKTKDENGEDIHYRNNRVDGTFALDDGSIISFTKDFHEKWTKKRGSNAEEFTGNETDYYIDGVPASKTEYDKRLAGICTVEMAQILTQPEHFPEAMPWQSRRKILLEACGDITEFDVINSSDKLKEITSFLIKPGTNGQFYSVEDYQKIAAAKKKEINGQLEQIPARIDEAAKAMPDITGIEENEVKAKIATLQKEKDIIAEEKANIGQSDVEQEGRRQIAEINTAIAEGWASFSEAKSDGLAAGREHISRKNSHLQEVTDQQQETRISIERLLKDREELARIRAGIVEQYKTYKDNEWTGETVCQTCGQDLPAESVEETKAKFNLHKSSEMERLRAEIEKKCSRPMIEDLDRSIEAGRQEMAKLNEKIEEIKQDIANSKEKIKPQEQASYEDTNEYTAYTAKIDEIRAKMESGSADTSESKRALQAKIDGLQERIGAEQQKLLMLQATEQQIKRIEQLEADEKRLSKEYDELSKGLYLCDEFIKAKVSLLMENINKKFQSVQFRLFKMQINGGLQEDCEVMIPTPNGLVPYSTANNAARINAGLEIIDTLARHWGVTMPVFVDNAESVVKLKEIESQVIRLVVSEPDKTLRIEA